MLKNEGIMSTQEPAPEETPIKSSPETGGGESNLGLIAYILFALGPFTGGLGSLAGVVVAYLQRDETRGSWKESHFTWLIRTFWIGLLFGIISGLLAVIGIGIVLGIAVFIWYVIRLVQGWQAWSAQRPVTKPESWLFT
jgi:uncharacterized membrane protein